MHHKHNKSLAKAVGHGITNMVTHNKVDAQLQADATVYAIQEVVNAMQQQQDKKFHQIMQLFQMMLKCRAITPELTMKILPMPPLIRKHNTPSASTVIVGTRRLSLSAGS